MNILGITALQGPNVYAHRRVLVMDLDLAELTGKESKEFPEFNRRLLEMLPGLHDHRCAKRRKGGFVERLTEGTFFSHITEHVALELSTLAGFDVAFGKSIFAGKPGLYHVVVEYRSEAGMRYLLRTAVEVVNAALAGQPFDIRQATAEATHIAERHGPGRSTAAIIKAASERGIPCIEMDAESLVQLGYGKHRHFVQRSMIEPTSIFGVDIASNKQLAKRILDQASIQVPRGVVVRDEGDVRRAIRELRFPLVVKPLSGNQGKGVTLNIDSEDVAVAAYHLASAFGRDVMLEEYLTGNEYRVLIVQGKAIAASHKTPSQTADDGAHDVTDIMHPAVARLCERAARLVGLDTCGVDLILPDISRAPAKREGGIVEVNASPGSGMHLLPAAGRRREVGRATVDQLFPGGTSGRIPIVAITGTNGKTSVTRMTAFILQHAGHNVGMTTTDGIWIGGELIARGDLTGFKSARTVLGDLSTEVAVLETARGGIVHSGLAYDWADVGVITNVQPDHIGQDGIESVEDLVHIKALVAERVCRGGTVVLNLDDDRVAAVADRRRVHREERKIVFFSLRGRSERLAAHVRGGGRAFYQEGNQIFEEDPVGRFPVVDIAVLPVTGGGVLEFQVANVMAAAASVRALNVAREQIAEALLRFTNAEHNPGRGDIFRVGRGYVMLDYGHNAHAFAAIAGLRERRGGKRVTGIVAVPGDRADWIIAEAGRVAARAFDRIVIREDTDLRGRKPGEAAAILLATIHREAPGLPCEVVLDWREALSGCIQRMREDELIVFFYEEYAPALDLVLGRQAVPLSSPEEFQMVAQHALPLPATSRPVR